MIKASGLLGSGEFLAFEPGEFGVPADCIGAVRLEGVDGALGESGDTICHGTNAADVWGGIYRSGKLFADKIEKIAGMTLCISGEGKVAKYDAYQSFIMMTANHVEAWHRYAHKPSICPS